VTAILKRQGLISAEASEAAQHWQRFEHPQPNALWQMDFKGHFALTQGRCHALTVIDDHSRFNLVLQACAGETFQDVQPALEHCFRRYGLPQRISCDNGPPWGTTRREDRLTRLGVWLIHLGVGLSHARPYHPQTNGKDERFHRTLDNAVLKRRTLIDQVDAQNAFDDYREVYNLIRPHDALGLAVPASRYRPSDREYPEALPPIEYDSDSTIRMVDSCGRISFKNQKFRISKALFGKPVAITPDPDNAANYRVYFCNYHVRSIDLRYPEPSD
jgi:transposase InsO family protein